MSNRERSQVNIETEITIKVTQEDLIRQLVEETEGTIIKPEPIQENGNN